MATSLRLGMAETPLQQVPPPLTGHRQDSDRLGFSTTRPLSHLSRISPGSSVEGDEDELEEGDYDDEEEEEEDDHPMPQIAASRPSPHRFHAYHQPPLPVSRGGGGFVHPSATLPPPPPPMAGQQLTTPVPPPSVRRPTPFVFGSAQQPLVSPEPSDSRPINAVGDSPQHEPAYASRGPEKKAPPSRQAKESSKSTKESKSEDSDDASTEASPAPPRSSSKAGWLPSILGRFRRGGGQEVHLPDDTNRSIIWDDQTKRWIDLNNPEPEEVPPPPPALSNSTHVDVPVVSTATANEPPMVPMGAPNAARSVRSPTGRPRYVNVLANQTSGSAAQKVGVNHLAPPLPPVLSSS